MVRRFKWWWVWSCGEEGLSSGIMFSQDYKRIIQKFLRSFVFVLGTAEENRCSTVWEEEQTERAVVESGQASES